MLVSNSGKVGKEFNLMCGELPSQARLFLNGILRGVMDSAETVLLGNVLDDPHALSSVKALAAAPLLLIDDQVVGAILVGNQRSKGFSQRQLTLLQTVAGQVALVVQNANLMAELEYKTMLQERTRLAREIHDGLAQTIGFLKLQVAQMSTYFARGEMERVKQSIDIVHTTLSEAYQDARQAIDGLRISTDGCGLADWIEQTSQEFEEISGLPVSLDVDDASLPAEIQAQLVRILQEALSNIRKHAKASHVWILCREVDSDLILEIRDNGVGFMPEDITQAARYGLQGMRERADLIGADFQVISKPKAGATVRLRLPLRDIGEAIL
jgi:two-component system nitrate/nitrite sensor histidine kinase NarX